MALWSRVQGREPKTKVLGLLRPGQAAGAYTRPQTGGRMVKLKGVRARQEVHPEEVACHVCSWTAPGAVSGSDLVGEDRVQC